jgi:hypothetical protein
MVTLEAVALPGLAASALEQRGRLRRGSGTVAVQRRLFEAIRYEFSAELIKGFSSSVTGLILSLRRCTSTLRLRASFVLGFLASAERRTWPRSGPFGGLGAQSDDAPSGV